MKYTQKLASIFTCILLLSSCKGDKNESVRKNELESNAIPETFSQEGTADYLSTFFKFSKWTYPFPENDDQMEELASVLSEDLQNICSISNEGVNPETLKITKIYIEKLKEAKYFFGLASSGTSGHSSANDSLREMVKILKELDPTGLHNPIFPSKGEFVYKKSCDIIFKKQKGQLIVYKIDSRPGDTPIGVVIYEDAGGIEDQWVAVSSKKDSKFFVSVVSKGGSWKSCVDYIIKTYE